MDEHNWLTREQKDGMTHRRCSYCGLDYLRLARAGEWQRYLVKSDGTVIRKPASHGGSMDVIPCRPR